MEPGKEQFITFRACFNISQNLHEVVSVNGNQPTPEDRVYPDFPSTDRESYSVAGNVTIDIGVKCKETLIRVINQQRDHPLNIQIVYILTSIAERGENLEERHLNITFLQFPVTPPSASSPPGTEKTVPPPIPPAECPTTAPLTTPPTGPCLSKADEVILHKSSFSGIISGLVAALALAILIIVFLLMLLRSERKKNNKRTRRKKNTEAGLNALVVRKTQ